MSSAPVLTACRPDPALPPFFKEGFLAFVAGMAEHPRPRPVDRETLRALSGDDRARYDETRKNWHGNLGPYATSAAAEVIEELWEFVDSNRQNAERVKPSIAVDGLGGTGKSTLLRGFAKKYHLQVIDSAGDMLPSGNLHLPVCLVTLDSTVTRLGLNKAILDFYGWPYPRTAAARDLTRHVHAAVLGCGTRVIVIDDVNHMVPTSKEGKDVSKHMKTLSTVLGVTFVFGGAGIKTGGLLTEGTAGDPARSPTGTRWSVVPVSSIPRPSSPPAQRDEWITLLKAFEKDIVLARAYPGMLSRDCQKVLWDKTSGNLASLSGLLGRACHRAVANGNERLDAETLAKMRTDDTAQTRYEGNSGTSPRRGTGTAAPARKVA